MKKSEIKSICDKFETYPEALKDLFSLNKKFRVKDESERLEILEYIQVLAEKDDVYVGDTANEYYTAGSTTEAVPLSNDKSLTKWGYPKGKVTKTVLNKRIAYMRKAIKDGKWSGRALRFAKHHLAGLIRQKETFGQ